ncbi:16S rRNA (cytidine(1402)-2'-O)-methyltransferase [Thiohalocapsa marina]|uniref:16S rRNA (cytidine(1402)-2'-O)-methyltransferase n=1 Tax=Thiohalocapsa marina TaxID=424902 RepID=UPI001FEC96B9|nr:16S rRNA (cytidine(1402)-2'-O)-methyltransferase [Thiohalocapsa marina]
MTADSSVLYVVATPIGNLADLSSRASRILAEADLIACEDTRHSRPLLHHLGIDTPLLSLHEHNEPEATARVLAALQAGKSVALISDAGTPLISDPGFVLVRAAREQGLRVVPVPGASAAICALSAAGLPSDRFLFVGFPPRGDSARHAWIESLAGEPGTLICYESGRRAIATLRTMAAVLGPRPAVVARELTKHFESFLSGDPAALADRLEADPEQQLGELVLLVEGDRRTRAERDMAEQQRVLRILADALPLKQAVALAARITGGNRNALYRQALNARDDARDDGREAGDRDAGA